MSNIFANNINPRNGDTVNIGPSISVTGSIQGADITGVSTAGITSAYIASVNDLNYPTHGPLANRNLFHNGDFKVSQRGDEFTSVTSSNTRIDRFRNVYNSLGTWTVTRDADTPVGLTSSIKLTCTTADPTPASGDRWSLQQRMEGHNLQHLAFGTSGAQPLVLSFWVKSNKTGGASINIFQSDAGSRHISTSYTINDADTWEYKVINIPADTGGQIDNDDGVGLAIDWFLNSGYEWQSGSYQSNWDANNVNANKNVNNLGVGTAVNDYWQMTGAQLELGTRATPFEHRTYDEELTKCQRYLYRFSPPDGSNYMIAPGLSRSTTLGRFAITFPTPMRVSANDELTVEEDGLSVMYRASSKTASLTNQNHEGPTGCTFDLTLDSGATNLSQGEAIISRTDSNGAYIQFEAEL
jgi:hypothetical protein